MSKKFIAIVSMIVLMTGFQSCKPKTDQESTSVQAEKDTLTSPLEETGKQVTGVLLDATMNTAVLVTNYRDTLSFATGGAEITAPERGMFIGDTLTVTYEGDLTDRSSFPIAIAKKVVVKSGEPDVTF